MATIQEHGRTRGRRVCDLLLACLAMAFFLPLLAAVALAIRADGSGPALCRRLCIRRDGRWVQTFAFRIAAGRGRWMARARPFLYRTRIDLLPQTIDVLRGRLTFIGDDRPGFLTV